MSTLSLLNPIFKDDYGEFVSQLNDQCWIWDNALPGDMETFDGRRVLHTIHTKRSVGLGARADNGTLPTAGNQTTKNIYIPLRYNYGRMQITGPTMIQSAAARGAFISGIQLEMDGLKKGWGRDICRQAWGTSNGVIARCASNSTVTVTLHSGTTAYQVSQIWADGGMSVDIGTVANPTLRTSANIVTDYGGSAGAYTITLTSAPGSSVDTDDYVFRSGNGGASDASGNPGDGQVEITGLQSAISATETLHALTVANGGKQWQSVVKSNSGTNRPITETLIMTAAMEAAEKSGRPAQAAACNRGVYISLINMLTASKRHVVQADASNSGGVKLRSGASGVLLEFPGWGEDAGGKLPVFADRDAPGNSLWGLDMTAITKYDATGGPQWIDEDGSVLHRVADKDKFEASLRGFAELGYTQRNGFWAVKDITEDA